jgi:hypothetical protein
MKFTLTYDGELRSNGDAKQKWQIRKQLSPQLEELWRINPALIDLVKRTRFVPLDPGWNLWETHHSADSSMQPLSPSPPDANWVDLCEPISKGGRTFLPLVRESLALRCGLKILFLRKEEPGGIYQGGDIDNRLKTLFDALAVPTVGQIVADPSMSDPIHCLMEDDAMIAGCSIETHRLLSRPDATQHEVRLVIEVDVRVVKARMYNHIFLGD